MLIIYYLFKNFFIHGFTILSTISHNITDILSSIIYIFKIIISFQEFMCKMSIRFFQSLFPSEKKQNKMVSIKIPCHFQVGAGGGTRTRMPKALDPKSSASTNFATPAYLYHYKLFYNSLQVEMIYSYLFIISSLSAFSSAIFCNISFMM